MPSVTDIVSIRSVALDRLAWAREGTDALVAAVPDEHLFARAGGKGNHAAWVMAHIAVTEDFCVSAMDGRPHVLDESLHRRFSGGTEVSDDPADHPSRAELLDALTVARQRLIAWYEALDEEAAAQRAPQFIEPLFTDALTLPFSMVGHEMFHAGQIAAVRSALGLKRVQA